MSDDNEESLHGFFDKLRPFVLDAVQKSYPASAVSLTALRNVKPELAKKVFVEAIISPAKQAIQEYLSPATLGLFEEIESRFLQDGITILVAEVELIVSSRMIAEMFERLTPEHEHMFQEPVRYLRGPLTAAGARLAHWIAKDIHHTLIRLAALRERRVQLLLTSALVGEDAVKTAAEHFAVYRRDSLMRSVWGWLSCQNLGETKLIEFADYIAKGSDEHIEKMNQQLERMCLSG